MRVGPIHQPQAHNPSAKTHRWAALRGAAAVALVSNLAACGSSEPNETIDAGPREPPPDVGCTIFPADNPWNQAVTNASVHARSDDYLSSLGIDRDMHPDFGTEYEGEPNGIPFVVVDGQTELVAVNFQAASESDPGPYPIPPNAPVEAGSDRHVIVVDSDACQLFELFDASKNGDDTWDAYSGARFDLSSNQLRPDGYTSADAAGLPIFAGLARYDEVVTQGVVNHAIRITARRTQNGYVHPATHAAGSGNASDPPMGLRLRMRSDYDCEDFSSEVQVLCTAFKTYGVIIADNGSSWYVSGAPDPRWDDDALRDLKSIPGSAFLALETGPITPQD